MKHIRYIAMLVTLFTISCTTEDHIVEYSKDGTDNNVQLVTRLLPFTEYDVATRAQAEDYVSMFDYIIFGTDWKCVYYKHIENSIVNIDRNTDFEGISQDNLNACRIFVVANYPGIYDQIRKEANGSDVEDYIKYNIRGKGLDYFTAISTPVLPTIDVPETGLPRYGAYPTTVDLTKTANIANGTTYQVDMQSLYAKMMFTVKVDPTEDVPSNEIVGNMFQLEGFTVHNLAQSVDFNGGIESKSIRSASDGMGTDDATPVYTESIVGSMETVSDLNPTMNLTFWFYVPERFVASHKGANQFEYPFGQGTVYDKESNPNGTIRAEDADLRQRYKPLLAQGYETYNSQSDKTNDKKATYVTISGTFWNHQGHSYNVNYDIYLGNDNFSNFDVVRNRQYNNIVTIKGIQNSADQSYVDGSVAIDHRVNIDRTLPIIINLRRETLLDAHFEVRPLRIRLNSSHTLIGSEDLPTHAKVDVTYINGNNWIGLERSFGDGVYNYTIEEQQLYCVNAGSSTGKRKYFTYDLVNPDFTDSVEDNDDKKTKDPLYGKTSVIVPITGDGECVWVYVDECTESSEDIMAVRSAEISVTCGKMVDDNFVKDETIKPMEYTLNQHKLFEVLWEERPYLIEHEEEYLHNFDAADTYQNNETEFEGIEWGLYNAQLSFDDQALFFDKEYDDFVGQIVEGLQSEVLTEQPIYYDFYVEKHDKENVSSKANFHNHEGYNFFNNIIKDINTKNDANRNTGYSGTIGDITLADMPENAIEYCYNRNKRYQNGKVAEEYKNWYLPAIDEMEDIMMGGHDYFDDFHGQHYWSCQPSYVRNYAYYNAWTDNDNTGTYYVDDTGIYYDDNGNLVTRNVGYARASKAVHISGTDYKYALSGASGYEDFFYLYTTFRWGIPPWEGAYEFRRSGNYNGIYFNTFERQDDEEEEGNHLRSTKHRVRAVYRRTTKNAVQVNNTTLKASDNENGVIDSDGWVQ